MAHQIIIKLRWARTIIITIISGAGITGISSPGTILALIGTLRAHTNTRVEVALGAGALFNRVIDSVGVDAITFDAITGRTGARQAEEVTWLALFEGV